MPAAHTIIRPVEPVLVAARAGRVRRSIRAVWSAYSRPARAYAVSIGAVGTALVVSLFAFPLDSADSVGALMFLAAVGLSGWYGGLRPALLSTVLGALAIDYFFELPRYMLQVTNTGTLTDLLSFLLVAMLLGSLNARLRAERNRAQAALGRARRADGACLARATNATHGDQNIGVLAARSEGATQPRQASTPIVQY